MSLACLLISGLVVLLAPTLYVSTVRVWVRDAPVTLDPEATNPRKISIDTEAQRVQSEQVLDLAGVTLDPGGAVRSIEVTAPPNSTVLQIRVTATEPELAQTTAAAIADSYLVVRGQYLEARQEARVRALREQSQKMGEQIVDAPNEAAKEIWRTALSEVSETESLAASTNTDPGRVIRGASNPVPRAKNLAVWPVSLAFLGGLVTYLIVRPRRRTRA
ncbi:MAG: hypothetical protein KDC39_12685 [Actinobacteria bacterium]|nr:hypothetical protein [Actinomycetota bacterium]